MLTAPLAMAQDNNDQPDSGGDAGFAKSIGMTNTTLVVASGVALAVAIAVASGGGSGGGSGTTGTTGTTGTN